MLRALLLGTALALLVGCGQLPAPPSGADKHVGARLFTAYRCITCHRINGVGQSTTGPDLSGDFAMTNYDLLTYYLHTPPSGMPAFRQLTPKEIADLSAFGDSSLKPSSNP